MAQGEVWCEGWRVNCGAPCQRLEKKELVTLVVYCSVDDLGEEERDEHLDREVLGGS